MPNSPSMAMMAMNKPHTNAWRGLSRPATHIYMLPQGAPVTSARRCANRGRSRRRPPAHHSPASLEPLPLLYIYLYACKVLTLTDTHKSMPFR